MSFNEKNIRESSIRLYEQIEKRAYSFDELQAISQLESSTLCLVLIQLIRENKLEQGIRNKNIYYRKCDDPEK